MTLFEENAEILRELARRGCALSNTCTVDFEHVFVTPAAAEAFARQVVGDEFQTRIYKLDEEDLEDEYAWNVTVSKLMIPTCEAITSTEEELAALARPCGGRPDGWGFFRE